MDDDDGHFIVVENSELTQRCKYQLYFFLCLGSRFFENGSIIDIPDRFSFAFTWPRHIWEGG